MLRWTPLLIVLTACASRPPAARLFAAGGGECTDPAGCEVVVPAEPTYVAPDDERGLPEEAYLGPAETREASCTDVGISAASMELGNYAAEEERAPTSHKYRARCVRARLDREERRCVFEAADAATIAYCAPRFWPEHPVHLVDTATCSDIAIQIRSRHASAPPESRSLWSRQLEAVMRSCQEDRWTVELAQCAANLHFPTQIAPNCQYGAPAPLIAKLTDRLARVK